MECGVALQLGIRLLSGMRNDHATGDKLGGTEMANIYDVIMSRKSVRTFDGKGITPEDRESIEKYIDSISNPFDIPVKFVLLDADEFGLSSPVLSGEKLYVTGIVDKVPLSDAAFGYSFEKLVLYAWSLGIGTTWIGGTMKRENFEKAAGLREGERMPCISPLGYPGKRSIKETLMRKGVKADDRKPVEAFFLGADLKPAEIGSNGLRRALELVRWAPSAVNKQPWRIIRDINEDGKFHFYEAKDKGYVSEEVGDMQKIDIGIALCHFMIGLGEEGMAPGFAIRDPGYEVPENMEYIATVTL